MDFNPRGGIGLSIRHFAAQSEKLPSKKRETTEVAATLFQKNVKFEISSYAIFCPLLKTFDQLKAKKLSNRSSKTGNLDRLH